ncbi:MAG: DNA recombination protein RmuC [Rickettsiaceae bacterium]|nr:DNA recombination protein RmuC [Rickettsiaceae bacterium]
MIYISIGICSILSASLLLIYIKYSNLKVVYEVNLDNLRLISQENHQLNEGRIELIGKIENLSATLVAKERAQEDMLKSSKSMLYDLSHSVANQLIEVHKKEINEARKQSEEVITKQSTNFNNELQRVANLVSVINKDFESSKKIVENLQNALLSPSATGALAEITLENLLKNSGLKDGTDYRMQYGFNDETHNKLRPDAVVFLPEDSLLIIDAKASQFLVSCEKPEDLAKTMNLHLKNLISKDYINELTKEFQNKKVKIRRINTIMFLPTDQAMIKVQESDKSFLEKAWSNNIYVVGPSGLLNILSIARVHISEKLRVDNYENIIHEISNLINSLASVSEHAFKLGNSLSSAISNYDKFAASFNRNIVSKASKLKSIGVTRSGLKDAKLLERFQLVSSKNELIEIEAEEEDNGQKMLKNID